VDRIMVMVKEYCKASYRTDFSSADGEERGYVSAMKARILPLDRELLGSTGARNQEVKQNQNILFSTAYLALSIIWNVLAPKTYSYRLCSDVPVRTLERSGLDLAKM
jgi:hypothetical protein